MPNRLSGQAFIILPRLTQQSQHRVWRLVRLRQHCRSRLLQNVVAGHACGFRGVVGIHDAAIRCRQVHRSGLQGGNGRCQPRHVGAEGGACSCCSSEICSDRRGSAVSDGLVPPPSGPGNRNRVDNQRINTGIFSDKRGSFSMCPPGLVSILQTCVAGFP